MDEVQAIEIVNINPATELSFSQGGGVGQSASRAEKEWRDFKQNIKIEIQLTWKGNCLNIWFHHENKHVTNCQREIKNIYLSTTMIIQSVTEWKLKYKIYMSIL